MTTESLQKAVCSYKSHIQQITELRKETIECLNEIESLVPLNRKEELAKLKVLKLPDSQLDNRPCVLFIGSKNCGKSTLLNTFLRKSSLLPTDETHCTSRIVRVVYSPQNQTKIENPYTKEDVIRPFKNKVPKKLVFLKGREARNDPDKLKVIVEVGLNHPLLECGIELIDSPPGRNENDALDVRVVEEFVEKGIVPLIVYVVDGNDRVREKDRITIRKLQDKFPNVTMMFVCTKVDLNMKAEMFDKRIEDDDEDCEDGGEDSQRIFELARQKKIAAFKELKCLDFLPSQDQLDTSETFHGISAKLVKRARKRNTKNYATMSFERFETCILEKLESCLRKQEKRELATLLSAQEMLLAIVVGKQVDLTFASSKMKDDLQRFKEAEETIFTMLEQLISKGASIVNMIGQDMERLSDILLQEAQDYKYTSKLTCALVEEFCRDTKNSILDRAFNVLRRSFQRALKASLLESVLTIEVVTTLNPFLQRMLQRTLGSEGKLGGKVGRDSGLANYIALDEVISSISDDVDVLLRNHIKSQMENFDVTQAGTKGPKPRDHLWRRKVVQNLLIKIDIKHLSDEVIRTCQTALWRKLRNLKENITAIELHSSFIGDKKATDMGNNHIPHLAQLAVRGHSLRYVIERGPPELDRELQNTAHSQLYACTSPLWVDENEESVVKVVAKKDVDQEVWTQTMRDCMHTKDINDKLFTRHPNILELRGWYFPDPDQLYIVMEKAECDLLAALQQGLSWKRRKEVAVDVAKGLEAIHRVQYIYQDLKPQNVMIAKDGTAKINVCKPKKPYENTKLGLPFHISPDMHEKFNKEYSYNAYDIYAFGSLLWVLCEGTGTNSPQSYSHCQDMVAMKFAVCDSEIIPERPDQTPDAWWDLMVVCWKVGLESSVDIKAILEMLLSIDTPPE